MATRSKTAAPVTRRVFAFAEGDRDQRALLGGKGANLAEMTRLGLPVPPGFTITTDACRDFLRLGRLPDGLMEEVRAALRTVEHETGKGFGDPEHALLVSVRSGAMHSMPGMMDTVLNLGLNDKTLMGLIRLTGDERFAYDAYRRFLAMFGEIVLGMPATPFEVLTREQRERLAVATDAQVPAEGWRDLTRRYLRLIEGHTGAAFPSDPMRQLELSIEAVFKSWNTERAIAYRRATRIADDLGTAVNVQAMVFGNSGEGSGTGVVFTRNPSTGERRLFGEYLENAQGEDVVAGVRTPLDIGQLEKRAPAIYQQLSELAERLEQHYREMQDVEFTVERGRLYLLQCRGGKRSGMAAVAIVVDMVREGLITQEEAVRRIQPDQLVQCLHSRLQEGAAEKARLMGTGLNAGPGAAVGRIAFDAETAIRLGKPGRGEEVILLRRQTSPDDLPGMLAAVGVLTAEGGRTSHAALVARQFGIPTVCGLRELEIDEERRLVHCNGHLLREGDWLTVDGTSGAVYFGKVATESGSVTPAFRKFMNWVDAVRTMGVRANADTPEQAKEALEFGAEGIGLCRTEHMFLGERLPLVQRMILARTPAQRQKALDRLLPLQRGDFEQIFRTLGARPVTIRLIDPPLHEFFSDLEADTRRAVLALRVIEPGSKKLARRERLLNQLEDLHEANPMLGLRGVRLSLLYPEIVAMQVRAIMEAAAMAELDGVRPRVEIMIPLVGMASELRAIRKHLEAVVKQVLTETGQRVDYTFGSMIEVPRACLVSEEIAREADFFSFGTNDLTQMTYALSRDDAGPIVRHYLDEGIFEFDPTERIDREGVGRLMAMAIEGARRTKPKIKIGICGEHGGDPDSIQFCHSLGLDYVSCSPRRVPVARLAAAHAALAVEGPADR